MASGYSAALLGSPPRECGGSGVEFFRGTSERHMCFSHSGRAGGGVPAPPPHPCHGMGGGEGGGAEGSFLDGAQPVQAMLPAQPRAEMHEGGWDGGMRGGGRGWGIGVYTLI